MNKLVYLFSTCTTSHLCQHRQGMKPGNAQLSRTNTQNSHLS